MKFLKSGDRKNGIMQTIEKATVMAKELGEAVAVCNLMPDCTAACDLCVSSPAEIKLVCFDMDATIIKTESINEIFKNMCMQNSSSATHNDNPIKQSDFEKLTRLAMNGKADFATNFKERVALLKGGCTEQIRETAYSLPLADGICTLMEELKARGIKTALITGNFNITGSVMQQRLGFDFVYTSVPEIRDGKLTGKLLNPIIDANAKADILARICRSNNIPLTGTIVVGDGANDIKMMSEAGIAVAYNAPKAKESIAGAILSLIKSNRIG